MSRSLASAIISRVKIYHAQFLIGPNEFAMIDMEKKLLVSIPRASPFFFQRDNVHRLLRLIIIRNLGNVLLS
jgi:hypothetical protein